MHSNIRWPMWLVGVSALLAAVQAELTFELVDNAKDCFHEEIKKNESVTLEFQVITGGQYDVDVEVITPSKQVIYQKKKAQYDSYQFHTDLAGVYTICFSNEFSTFSHKIVYFDLQVGEEAPLLESLEKHATSLTKMETSAQDIHKALERTGDFQTHHRLRENQGRKRAEDLNERVLWWSIIETFGILTISIGQVLILRNFFTERKPNAAGYARM